MLFWVQGFENRFFPVQGFDFRLFWVQGFRNRFFPVWLGTGLRKPVISGTGSRLHTLLLRLDRKIERKLVTIYARVLRQSESKVSQRITSTDKQIHRGTFQFSQHSNPHCAKQDDTRPTRAASSSSIGTSSLGIL